MLGPDPAYGAALKAFRVEDDHGDPAGRPAATGAAGSLTRLRIDDTGTCRLSWTGVGTFIRIESD